MRQFKRTTISLAVAQMVMLGAGAVYAQTDGAPPAPPAPAASQAVPGVAPAASAASAASQPQPGVTPAAPQVLEAVVVRGQRAALQSAQKRKQDSEEIMDAVDAEEAGKLPDKSIAEVLQRVVGVTIRRQRSLDNDAKHFSEEGSGIRVRGLSWGSSALNGREVFSAGWPGRDLSWSAVPSELIVGVDTYKNPSAEQIEGGVSGLVNLRTGLPFDYNGTKGYVSFGTNYQERSKKSAPAVSGLYTTQWDAESGRWGALVDLAVNNSTYESDSLQVQPYYARTDAGTGRTVWAPNGASWGKNVGSSDRKGFYGALQWKKNEMQSALTYFVSGSREEDTGSTMYTAMESPYKSKIDNAVIDDRGVVTSGTYSYPTGGLGANDFPDGGIMMGTGRNYNEHKANTSELAWNFKWTPNERWAFQNDLQWVHSKFETIGREVQLGTFLPSMDITVPQGSDPVQLGFSQASRDFLANPGNYYWNLIQPNKVKGDANLYAWKADAKFIFDDPVLRDLRFGVRAAQRSSDRERATFASDIGSGGWSSIARPWEVRRTSTPGQNPSLTDDLADRGWAGRGTFAYLKDPRYAAVGPVELFSFADLAKGRYGQLPSVVFPTYDMMKDYPNTYNNLMSNVRMSQCMDGVAKGYKPDDRDCYKKNPDGSTFYGPDGQRVSAFLFDGDLQYGLNPNMKSSITERSYSAYSTLRFGFDDWKVPVDGNIGVRAVYSEATSHGFIVFEPKYESAPPDLPRFDRVNEPLDVTDHHLDLLPSMNLRFNLTGDDKLIGRIAAARSMYRPGFQQLQESVGLEQKVDYTNHRVSYIGSNTGNVKLKPLKANSFDLALEWYPRSGQAITATVFYKEVKDLVYDGVYTRSYNSVAGNPQVFTIKGPQNAAQAWLHGIELGADTYLDHLDFLKDALPDWAKGFGVSANYTYIGSSQKFYRNSQMQYCPKADTITNDSVKQYGCDTNGIPIGELPLPGLTKNAANFALRYDRSGFSARLAYSWNSRTLQQIGGYGPSGSDGTSADPNRVGAQDTWWGLPKWQEAYGQWDGSVSYNITDKFSLSLSASNLANVKVRETVQQTPGDMTTSWRFPGRSYYLSGRYEF